MFPASARADAPTGDTSADLPSDRPISDRFTFAFVTGFGYGFEMRPRTQGSDVADVRLLTLMPQARFELFDRSQRSRWYDGRLDLVFEPQLAINFVPSTGFGGAASAGLRYGFQNDRAWSPYMLGLVGIGGIDFDLVDQDDGFEFWLQFGVGIKRKLGPVALTGDIRIYHISNAQTHLPNAGIDTILFTLGIETP